MTAHLETDTPVAPDRPHHRWCEGHIDCPDCNRETCARVVVWAPGGVPHTVICLGCLAKFVVAIEAGGLTP